VCRQSSLIVCSTAQGRQNLAAAVACLLPKATPEGWKQISRLLASVTTGNRGARVLAPRPGCRDSVRKPRGFAATRLNPWLIYMHLFGVPLRDPTKHDNTHHCFYFHCGLCCGGRIRMVGTTTTHPARDRTTAAGTACGGRPAIRFLAASAAGDGHVPHVPP